VEVPAAQFTRGMLQRLKEILAAHPGRTPVEIHYVNGHVVPAKVGDGYCVDATEGLLSELRRLLGPGAVRVEVDTDAAAPAEPAVSLRGGP
jgi:hypothetical protein